METRIDVQPLVAIKTKKCGCCGKDLPLSCFSKKGTGYRSICKDCEKREVGATDRFKDFTSRELIEELKARGYKGSLRKEIVEKVKL